MSSVGPVVSTALAPSAIQQGSTTASVVNAPSQLQSQAQGATLQGTVVGQNSTGTVLSVRTSLGVITISTTASPPPGSNVQIQVVTPGVQTVVSLQILAARADAAGAQGGSSAVISQGSAGLAGIATTAIGGAPTVTLPGGQVATFIPAIFNGPLGGQILPSGQGPQPGLQPGPLGGGIAGFAQAAGIGGTVGPAAAGVAPFGLPIAAQSVGGAAGGQAPVLTGTPGAVASGASILSGVGTSAGLSNFAPGTPIAVRILGLQPPGAAQPAIVSQAAGNFATLSGIVGGVSAEGLPFVDTAAGRITLQSRSELPVGTRLTIEIAQRGFDPGVPQTLAGRALSALSTTWNGLGEALQALAAGDPAAARALTAALPQPTANLGSSVLFVLAALRGGDLRGLVPGDAREALNRIGRNDILRGLSDRLGQLRGLSGDQVPPGDWRAFPIPLYSESKLEQLMLYVRKYHGKGGEDGETVEGTRFVVDFDLSKMGQVQLDGLVREKRFDLMFRSHEAVPLDIRNHVTRLFQEANEITGFKGSISFQTVAKFPVAPMEDIADRLDVRDSSAGAGSDRVTI